MSHPIPYIICGTERNHNFPRDIRYSSSPYGIPQMSVSPISLTSIHPHVHTSTPTAPRRLNMRSTLIRTLRRAGSGKSTQTTATALRASTTLPTLPTSTAHVRYATSMRMPAMSPTMTEGGIAGWKKAEGESFAAGDVLLEIVSCGGGRGVYRGVDSGCWVGQGRCANYGMGDGWELRGGRWGWAEQQWSDVVRSERCYMRWSL